MTNIDYFTNLDEFEAVLRSRAEANIDTFAEKINIAPLDLSLTLCEIHELNDELWIQTIGKKFSLEFEDVLAALMEVWMEVGDDYSGSPLIDRKILRL